MNSVPFIPTNFGEQIFKQRYAIHPEETWDEACRRIANFIAGAEHNGKRVEWEDRFYNELVSNRFIPGGRIMYGAGRPTSSLINCFVIGGTPDMDSRQGWAKYIGDMLIISSLGGGVGMSASTIRPRGTPIHGTGGEATGAVSFMQIVNSVAEEIRGGGGRRAALLFCLNMNHPDLPEFIDKKFVNIDLDFTDPLLLTKFITEKLGVFDSNTINAVKEAIEADTSGVFVQAIRLLFKAWLERNLRCANVSVLFDEDPEEFFEKVKNDDWHEFKWKGQVVTKVKAKEVWEKIISNSMHSGEPGILNFYLANKMSNIHSVGPLTATNPCFSLDNWVQTSNGPKLVSELINKKFTAIVDGKLFESTDEGFFKTGRKDVFKVTTLEGYSFKVTSDHKLFKAVRNKSKRTIIFEKTPLSEIKIGDFIKMHNHRGVSWVGSGSYEEGWLLGNLVGDGTFYNEERAKLQYWGEGKEELYKQAVGYTTSLYGNYNGRFASHVTENIHAGNSISLSSTSLAKLALSYGISRNNKRVTEAVERASSDFYKGFIKGLFDADGSIQGNGYNGISIRLAQSNIETIERVHRMLARLGIRSKVYRNRRNEGKTLLPDSNRVLKEYNTKAQHEIIFNGDNIDHFLNIIGFSSEKNKNRVVRHLSLRKTFPRKEKFILKVKSIEHVGIEDVYNCTIPGPHSVDVGGCYLPQCGEVTLSPNELCCLGQIVLSRFVTQNSKIDWEKLANTVHVAIRFLDNVLDATVYPTEEIKAKATSTRRIGLGITALHDTLLMCGLKYSSEEGRELAGKIMKFISNKSYEASAFLAVEKGTYPAFNPQDMETSGFIKGLKPSVRYMVKEKGIRNCALNSIAPTGTVSIVSGVSSGIEPIMGPAYKRMFWVGDKKETEIVVHPLFEKFVTEGRDVSHFEYGEEVQIKDHLEMQAVMQQYVDQSISKTIMLHKDVSKKKFSEYLMEYIPRVKGVTVYPVGSRGETPITPIPLKEAISIVKDKRGRIGTSIEQETQDCPSGICTLG